MKRIEHDDDVEQAPPQTQTSAQLIGGAPPIPPHNTPPTLTAIATPDPEDDEGQMISNVIEEGPDAARRYGYTVTRIFPGQRLPPRQPTEQLSVYQKIQAWVGETATSVMDALSAAEETFQRARIQKRGPKSSS